MVTLTDISLAAHGLDTMPRLASLRRDCLAARAEVCIERARHVTAFLKDMADAGEPMEVRYARAVAHYLRNKTPFFPDDNLLAGTTTSKRFGAPVYPELTGMTIWPELDVMSTREKNPQRLAKEDAEALNLEVFPYWLEKNILERTRAEFGNPPGMRLFERIVFFIASKAGAISHTVPCYQIALTKGLNAIIMEAEQEAGALQEKDNPSPEETRRLAFYQAVPIALRGLIAYAENLSGEAASLARRELDPARKANLMAMAGVCARVPAEPARNFREALNAIWLLQIGIHAENINMAMSPGRLDQLLLPYFLGDLAAKTLNEKEALELIGCFWLKLNDNTNLVPETGEELFGGAGTVPAVTLGGIDQAGEDAVNDLTYLMLRATELLKTRDPSVNARYHHEKNSATYLRRVAEVIASTKAVPALYNDLAAIKTLEHQGVRREHARDYAVIGCVELSAAGRSYDASSSIMLNLVSALELALYNGKRPVTGDEQIGPRTGSAESFKDFNSFWKAFTSQLGWLIGQAIGLNEQMGRIHQQYLPSPLLSALFEGPLSKGRDLIFGGALYNSSGATHIGFADTVDSLNAIEQAVFSDRKYSLPRLLKALEANFAGEEEMHAWLVNRTPKFGSDHPVARKNSENLVRFLFDTYQAHENYRGGRYRPAYWTMTNHAGQGKLCGALPNGRKANRVFASGITPVSHAATDLAACLHAVADIDSRLVPGGVAFNLKYPSLRSEEERNKFSQAIEAYFRSGGLHIQFNIMSYEMLLDAKAHPDDYPELLVRVSGYSAYFKDLNEAMQDEIITRTAYELDAGSAVPFPPKARAMLPTESAPGEAPRKLTLRRPQKSTGNPMLDALMAQFQACVEDGVADTFLETLLRLMSLALRFDRDFRKNIDGFHGSYLFVSKDGGVTAGAVFAHGHLEVTGGTVQNPHITIQFKDGKALMDFLLTPKPDILGSMLRQEISLNGNLNYLYKFAYLARRLQLKATGQA
ncbi:pyruvate formate lyase family protein [Thiovibrio sp. JS02]